MAGGTYGGSMTPHGAVRSSLLGSIEDRRFWSPQIRSEADRLAEGVERGVFDGFFPICHTPRAKAHG
jgi:hypothetical protein